MPPPCQSLIVDNLIQESQTCKQIPDPIPSVRISLNRCMPKKRPKRGRLWFNDGSCVRLRAEYPNHLWSYGFVFERTHDNRPLRILTMVDEYTRERLVRKSGRRITSEDVIHTLADLFIQRGAPAYLRSDNGPEFTATAVREWLERLRVQTLFIEPDSPWENGYVESFNGKLRDELPNREISYTLTEAEVLLERWRVHYNTKRPHSSLGYRPPAPEASRPPTNSTNMMKILTPKSGTATGGTSHQLKNLKSGTSLV